MPTTEITNVEPAETELPQLAEPTGPTDPAQPAEPAGRRRRGKSKEEETGEAGFFERPPSEKGVGPAPDSEWESHMAYLYRLEPVLDLTRGGTQPKYVTKFASSFDPETVKLNPSCGSGVYKVQLVKYNSTHRKNETVHMHIFEVLDPAYPPKVPAGAWMEDPRNERWNWAKQGQGQGKQNGQDIFSNPNPSPLDIAKFIRDEIRQSRPDLSAGKTDALTQTIITTLPSLLEQARSAADPTKVMAMLQSVMPKPSNEEGSMMKFLLEELRAVRASNEQLQRDYRQLLTDIATGKIGAGGQAGQAPPVDPIEQLTAAAQKLTALYEVIQPNPNAAAPGTWWQELLKPLVEATAVAVPLIAKNIGNQPAPLRRPPAPASNPATPAVPAIPTAAAPPPGTPNTPPPGTPPASPPAPPTIEQHQPDEHSTTEVAEDDLTMYARFIAQSGPSLIKHLNDGSTGADYAYWLYDGYGMMAITMIKNLGAEQLKAIIAQQVPELWTQLSKFGPRFDSFLEEFMNWTLESDEETDAPAAPEPAPAPANNEPKKKPAAAPKQKAGKKQ